MEELIHNLTDSQLQTIIKNAIKEALDQKSGVLTSKNLFNDVRLDRREIELINDKYDITNVLTDMMRGSILTNISFPYGWESSYTKVFNQDIHNNIKKVVLNVFGKTKNSDLTRDEYEMARELYAEVRDWFLEAYEQRLMKMDQQKKLTTPASK